MDSPENARFRGLLIGYCEYKLGNLQHFTQALPLHSDYHLAATHQNIAELYSDFHDAI